MKIRYKFFLLASILFLALSSAISAQSIYFCESVDDEGYPVNDATTFTIPDDGGYLYVLVRLPYEVDCSSVRYEIYRNGNYDNTVYLDTDYGWSWFWKEITFYKRGTYDFYIYDCDDYELASGTVKINYN